MTEHGGVQGPQPQPAAAATVGGRPVPADPDTVRMRRERHERIQAELAAQGVDARVRLGTGHVAYATGAHVPAAESGRAALLRTVAVVLRGEAWPHVFTPFPEGLPPELPAEHRHGALLPDLDDAQGDLSQALAALLPEGGRTGVDELTHPLARVLAGGDVVPASAVLAPAKLVKTVDELACIAAAQRLNELAMPSVRPLARPGTRQTELTAAFLARIYELGAHANVIDPIWQVMPPSLADGPWTTHGGIAFPTPTTDRFLRDGDVVWVDTGIHVEGYASDFGRTWIARDDPSARPTSRQEAQFERWQEVMAAVLDRCKPGSSGADLARAATEANGGSRPWIDHFYLAHGVGTESAELPMIGTDLGEAFDEQQVLAPGMVLVLEPVVWDDGAAGYRAEEIVAITDDGWTPLSGHPYDPFGTQA